MGTLPAWVLFALFIAAVFIVVLWIMLPFAVFGVKPLLRELLREQQRTNEELLRGAGRSRSNGESSVKPRIDGFLG